MPLPCHHRRQALLPPPSPLVSAQRKPTRWLPGPNASQAKRAPLPSPPCRRRRQAPLPPPYLRPGPRAHSVSRRISGPAPKRAEQSKRRCRRRRRPCRRRRGAPLPPLTSDLSHEHAARADASAAWPRRKPSEASTPAPPSADAVAAANVHGCARERR